MLDKILGILKAIKDFYVDHHVDYMPEEGEEDTYVIGIFIKVKAKEDNIKMAIPLLDKFIEGLFKKGKIIVPISKNEQEKIRNLTRIRLRFKGKGVVD